MGLDNGMVVDDVELQPVEKVAVHNPKDVIKKEMYGRDVPTTTKDMVNQLNMIDALVDEEINPQKPINATFMGFYFKEPQTTSAWTHSIYSRIDGANIMLVLFEIVLIVLFAVYGKYSTPSVSTAIGYNISLSANTWQALETYLGFWTHMAIFCVAGFGGMYAHAHKFILGSYGSVLLVSAFTLQWAILVQGFFVYVNSLVEETSVGYDDVLITPKALVEAMFPVAAVLVSYGAFVGKASTEQLVFVAFWEVIFYCCNVWINRDVINVVDYGCFFIYVFGTAFGLGASSLLSRADSKNHTDNHPGHLSDALSMVGAMFIFVYFPSFNVATFELGNAGYRVVMNTVISMCASTVTAFTTSKFLRTTRGQYDLRDVRFGMMAGGIVMASAVSITASAGVAAGCGAAAGVAAVACACWITPLLEAIGLRDSVSTHGYFGGAGLIGLIASICSPWYYWNLYNTELLSEQFSIYYQEEAMQPLYQLCGYLISIAMGVMGGCFAGFFAKLLVGSPLRYWNDASQYRVYSDYLEKEEKDIRERIVAREEAKAAALAAEEEKKDRKP